MNMRKYAKDGVADWGREGGETCGSNGKDGVAEGLLSYNRFPTLSRPVKDQVGL